MGVDWGDYDNDGRLDLLVGTYRNEVKCLYHNDGLGVGGDLLFSERGFASGLGQPTKPYVTFGCKFIDADNDGWLDILFVNGHVLDNAERFAAVDHTTYRQPIQFLRNIQGRFEDASESAGVQDDGPIVGRGLAIGDYDNDGRMDVLVVDSEGEPHLLHNTASQAGRFHWIAFQLVGDPRRAENRDGLGAIVTINGSFGKRVRSCQAAGSYLSSSDKRVHFGLGNAALVSTVTVRWPGSGRTQTWHNLVADHYYRLRSGATGVSR